MNNSSHQIRMGAIISYIVIAINMLSGVLYTPWMIRTIGQDNYGIYTLATSLISIFLLDFGMSAAVSRFISKYNAEDDKESVNNLLGIVYKLYIIIDAVILFSLIVVFLLINMIYAELTPTELVNFKIVYIMAATFSVISFPFTTLNGIFTAFEEFVGLKICDLFNKIFSILLIILALLFDYGLYGLVAANAVSGVFTIILKLIIIKRKVPIKVNFSFRSTKMLHDIFGFSIWSTVISIADRLIFNITPSILGALSGSISIALFGIASTLEGYVFTFANAINGLFLPKVSRMVAKENSDDDLLQLMIKIGRIQLAIVGLLVIGFISVGKEFIFIWLGKDYLITYYCAIILILPSLISLTQEIANTAVIALNKVKIKSYVFMITSILNIILSIIFSQYWGALGASIAISTSYFIRYIIMNIVYYKVVGIDIFVFFKECHARMMIPLLLSLAIGTWIPSVTSFSGWSGFLVNSSLITVGYIIIMWFLGFNNFEKKLILGIFPFVKK